MVKVRYAVPYLMVVVLAASTTGCGNRGLGQVSGTVTLDGAPVADATVMFTPLGGGRPAAGVTDASGKYTLIFDRSGTGAQLGEHVVEIRTGGERVGEDDTVTEIPETIPAARPT